MQADDELDARGMICPMPVLKARQRLAGMPVGAVLGVTADDPAAELDVPHFCGEAGHAFLGAEDAGRARRYLIRKGEPAPAR